MASIAHATCRIASCASIRHDNSVAWLSPGVRRAEAMPRVSEWVPEILQYIEVIIQKGFAYKSAGSVFFDTCKFE
jgi:cysteinyl-tRNA synthetase